MTDKTHRISRRLFVGGGLSTAALVAGCGNGVGSGGAQRIDGRVNTTRNFLFSKYPQIEGVEQKSTGALYMPLITKAGFGAGGAYGRGALRINNATVDYYNSLQASFGLQIGAQQYSHALFFMTSEALREFRSSNGWSIGADAEYAINDRGENLSAETITALAPVVAVVFGQSGLIIGATLEGTKYNRIIP